MVDPAELARRVQALEDIEAIAQLTYRYWRHLDMKQFDALAECFVPEATCCYSSGKYEFSGRDAIMRFLRESLSRERGSVTIHHGHHPEIALTGPDTATGTWALYNYMYNEAENRGIRIGAYYEDRYVKVGGAWKFQHIGYTSLFHEEWKRDDIPSLVAGVGPPAARATPVAPAGGPRAQAPGAASDLQGFVDSFDGSALTGWAWDRAQPARTVSVAIYVDELFVAEVPADRHRDDLRKVSPEHPEHAFTFTLPGARTLPLRQGTMTVKFAGTDRPLEAAGTAQGLVNRPPMGPNELIHLLAHSALQPKVPPKLIAHISGQEASEYSFRIVGAGVVVDMLAYGLLRLPPGTVVDIGCGCGRVAIQMAPWFAEHGEYWGFDTWAEGITWAQQTITPLYPKIQFRALGQRGNAPGGYEADTAYTLPLADGAVSAVLATSLFTHLTDSAARAYLREIARLLKPGGGAYLTFFLHDAESAARLGNTRLTRVPGGYRFDHPTFSDFFYEEAAVLDMVRDSGLVTTVREFGLWRGDHYRPRRAPVGYQDLLILRKPG